MAWLAVDLNGTESVFISKPARLDDIWVSKEDMEGISLRDTFYILKEGTIEGVLGRKLSWRDEPVEVSMNMSDFDPAQMWEL